MQLTADEALMNVYYPPKGTSTQGIVDEYLGPYGYTIYRTEYNVPNSDQLWHSLLHRLDADLKQEITYTFQQRQHIPEEREATEKLISLVQFDGRSDPSLDSLSLDQLRTVFKDRVGGSPLNADDTTKQFFLVADAEVLDAVSRGEYWVKLAEVHYDDAEHRQNFNSRYCAPQVYWGWVKVATTALFYLRTLLDSMALQQIAPMVRKGEDFPVLDDTEMAEAD